MNPYPPNVDRRPTPARADLHRDHADAMAVVRERRRALRTLQALRRRPAPRERVLRGLALGGTVVLHLLLVLAMIRAMHPRPWHYPPAQPHADDVLSVRLIGRPRPAVPPPPPRVLPATERTTMSKAPPPRSPAAARPPADTADAAAAVSVAPAAAPLRLYDRDGRLRVGPDALQHLDGEKKTPDYVQRQPQGNSDVMQRSSSQVKYKPTRFSEDWKPDNETIVGAAVRHVINATGRTAHMDLPGHAHLQCKTVLFVIPTGCGIPPAKAPAESDDSRLNMAPTPLVPGMGAKAHVSAAECERLAKAGQPLPEGCPRSARPSRGPGRDGD